MDESAERANYLAVNKLLDRRDAISDDDDYDKAELKRKQAGFAEEESPTPSSSSSSSDSESEIPAKLPETTGKSTKRTGTGELPSDHELDTAEHEIRRYDADKAEREDQRLEKLVAMEEQMQKAAQERAEKPAPSKKPGAKRVDMGDGDWIERVEDEDPQDDAAAAAALFEDANYAEMVQRAQIMEATRNSKKEAKARKELEKSAQAQSDHSNASNNLSQLGTAAVGLSVIAAPTSAKNILKLIEASHKFDYATFTKVMGEGAPQCYNDHCDSCVMYEIAAAYAADPKRLTELIRNVKTVQQQQPPPPAPAPIPIPPVVHGTGSRTKKLLDWLQAHAPPVHEDAAFMNPKYPWKVLRIIPPDQRPKLEPVTRCPKLKFGPQVTKQMTSLLDQSLIPLVNSGRLELSHLTLIPDIDFTNMSEEQRLRQYARIMLYWMLLHQFFEEHLDIIIGLVNMEVHPEKNSKRGARDRENNQQVENEFGNEEQPNQEQMEEQAREEAGLTDDFVREHENDNYQELERKLKKAADLIAQKNRQKQAELVQAINEAVQQLDVLYIPLVKKKSETGKLSKEENGEYKRLKARREKLVKARPNIMVGYPHIEMVILRERTAVAKKSEKNGEEKYTLGGVSTLFELQQYLYDRGIKDTVQKRMIPKKKGTATKKDSFMKDLTWEFRYPLIGHNCGLAMQNMKAAGILLDGKRGVAWMYYNESKNLPLHWHNNWKNFIAQLQKLDGISLSDEADTWKYDPTVHLLNAEEASDEQLMLGRVSNLMRDEGLYIYANTCVVRVKPGTEMGMEIAYENMDAFALHLNENPILARDLLGKMSFLESKYIVRLPLRRIDLCFDIVEGKDFYFCLDARNPDKWPAHLIESKGFYKKYRDDGQKRTYKMDGIAVTTREMVQRLAWDPRKKGSYDGHRLLAFSDPDLTMEMMQKPPENWIKGIARYGRPKNANAWAKLSEEIEQAKERYRKAKVNMAEKEANMKKPPKVAKGNNTASFLTTYTWLESQRKLAKKELKEAEKKYFALQCWTPQDEIDFYEHNRNMFFVPTNRQKNLFIVGKHGAGKTVSLAYLYGQTLETQLGAGVPFAKGLFEDVNRAMFGGQFSTQSIVPGVTRVCIINEMMVSRARIDETLTFLEHGSIELHKKHKADSHGHATFAKAFTGNKRLEVKGRDDLTKALNNRFRIFFMNKKITKKERDPAYEAKVRLEKFQIAYFLVTKQYEETWIEFWINPRAFMERQAALQNQ